MMVKERVNVFGHTGCLVTRAAFSASGKVEIVAIIDPFIDSTTWSTCSSMTLPTASSTTQSRLRWEARHQQEAHHHLPGTRSR
ncbi:rCG33550 [Rattus norvegicus]|uniref:RCG33550 n=1 Tax=Rattus norvegicus TaxID=10116 RepID=A6HF35_RAT|nr:rCG33550 [Rattus norvegicus]